MSRTIHNLWLTKKVSVIDKNVYSFDKHTYKNFYKKHKKNRVQLRSIISKIIKGDIDILLSYSEKVNLRLKKC